MKSKILIIISLLFSISFLAASSFPFVEDYFYEKTIVACFDKSVMENNEGKLNFSIENNIVKTRMSSFNILAEEFKFVNLERFISSVKHLEWNEDGVYLQNIYRIFLESNSNIEAALNAVMKDQNILYAEYETINRLMYIPDDPLYSAEWHLPKMECPEVWDYTVGDEEVIIGIVDQGIKWNHPDLVDNIWINEPELNSDSGGNPMNINWTTGVVSGGNGIDDDGNGKVDDCIGWSFASGQIGNQSYQDYVHPSDDFLDNDHGTHVAGCAGAVGDNGIGVVGPSMNVRLISSRHASTNYTSDGVYDALSGMTYCADSGADIINCSFGGPGGGSYYNNVVNYCVTNGALVIAAASNDDLEHNTSYHIYPADCTNVLCVAATDHSDMKADFSDYGDPIDISAPGVSIRSTINREDGYGNKQGTSMASPIAAGVAALVKSMHPSITPLDLRQRMMDTADYIDDINQDYAGLLGSGRVNAFTATMYDLIPRLTIVSHNLGEYEGDGDGVPNPGEVLNFSIMVQNGYFLAGFWANATGVTATLSCDVEGVEILQGTSNFPDIAGGISVWNNDNPFRLQTPENTSIYDLPLTVTITSNQSSQNPYEVVIEIDADISLTQQGWPFEVGGASSSSALIIDINNDGNNEVVFGDHLGMIHAVLPDGSGELAGYPLDLGSNISSAVAVQDINNNGFKEIIIGNESSNLIALDHTGTEIFSYSTGGQVKGNPMIADVDDNGSFEIIALTFTGNNIIVLNADGTDFGNFPVTSSSGVLSSPAVGDLDNDGNLEIIAVTLGGDLLAISTATEENITGFPFSLGMGSWNGPIVSNIDTDPEPEILIGTLGGDLKVVNHDGTLNFEKLLDGMIRTSIVTADLDNNGSVEIIYANSNGNLYVIDNQGNDLTNFPLEIGTTVESTPVIADLDDDGNLEMIFGDSNGYLHSIGIDGMETDNFPIFLENTLKISPAIGYADSDDDPEIIIANQSAFFLIDYKRLIGDIFWPCFKGNPARTGDVSDLVFSENNEVPDFETSLYHNYPNPFVASINEESVFNFSLKERDFVTLEVFNIRGQRIKTLLSNSLSYGNHTASWNGFDENNRQVSSGIYFYKLSTSDYSATRKMILIR